MCYKTYQSAISDDCPIAAANDPSCFGRDGNFRKQVELNTTDRFTISLTNCGPAKLRASQIPGQPYLGLKSCIGRRCQSMGVYTIFA